MLFYHFLALNLISFTGLCDSLMSVKQVLEVIKDSVKTNLVNIDKVIIVCSGRIEKNHEDSIKQFMEWLYFNKYKHNFSFIYNKSDGLSEAEKLENLTYMCDTLGADPKATKFARFIGDTKAHTRKLNLALGFPPNVPYKSIKDDHINLKYVINTSVDKRIPVDKSKCVIL